MDNDHVRGEEYEQINVHNVYSKIATHFSSTRYKPWPVIDDFLRSLTTGSIGLDIGCGNGKYLAIRDDIYIVASDRHVANLTSNEIDYFGVAKSLTRKYRSSELIEFATQHEPHSAIVADILSLPHPGAVFDFAISIAVIHHLSTRERRVDAVRAILNTLRPYGEDREGSGSAGEALFFVWALEQKNSRRGWDVDDEQDQMVPWVLKAEKSGDGVGKTYHRYYHLYRRGELEEDIVAAGGEVVRSGYDRDNWWSVARRC